MNEKAAKAGITSAHEFIETFNSRDHELHSQSLNYPHIRLAKGHFSRIDSAQEFTELSRKIEPLLDEEGWHHTKIARLEVIHAGTDKAHLAIINDRCHKDGSVYYSFETFWIATLINGHWGIQFRSSFLHAS